MGLESVLQTMRYLQLNWLGRVRNVPLDRLPRQLLVSWMSEPRLCNYNQTYSRTVLKALTSVGIEEADWPALAENEIEWSCYVRQAVGERERLRREHGLNAFRVLHCLRDCRVETNASNLRRIECALCGGVFPAPTVGQCAFPTRVQEARRLNLENCFDPTRDRAQHQSNSPESLNAQMLLNVGKGGNLKVRNSMSGLHFCREQWLAERPSHRFSWMNPAFDDDYGRDPDSFVSSSNGPSTEAPIPHCHLPTHLVHCTPAMREAAEAPEACTGPSFFMPVAAVPPEECEPPRVFDQVRHIIDYIPHDPTNAANPLLLPVRLLPRLEAPQPKEVFIPTEDGGNAVHDTTTTTIPE